MSLEWFNAREVARVGAALADQLAPYAVSISGTRGEKAARGLHREALSGIFQRADREVRPLRLNFYKRAKFANSFKWRLLEKGVQRELADEVTQRLVMHLSLDRGSSALEKNTAAAPAVRPDPSYVKHLLDQGNNCIAQGACAEALVFYQNLLGIDPSHSIGLNNLGGTFCKLRRFKEAEECFRGAVRINPQYVEAQSNLGNILRWRGQIDEAEIWLRRALKLKPKSLDARQNLGLTLVFLGRLREAKAQYRKVLKIVPRHADALFGMGYIAAIEGGFDQAAAMFKRALEVNPKMPSAWAAIAGIRKMTSSDGPWLEGAEVIAASGIAFLEEANVRFAIGKYCDDLGDFERAFHSYKLANALLKSIAENYERADRARFVDDLISVYTRKSISKVDAGASASMKPVFVVGMMRSGTSLAEQIISSHPAAKGAGELDFWSDAVREHGNVVRQGLLGESTREKLAETYLRTLEGRSGDALRIVDKTPVNSDYLGVIHSVFPNARIIYMRRDPIDTCLSCYFQQLSPALNYSMDLSDLAHYYREHRRLVTHWRAVLPPGTILDVPYEQLVADPKEWTRTILDFLGLEWDERCLDFHNTKRAVVTASYWQVRQKIYSDSVQRWRNYEKFIGPLEGLKNLES